MRTFKRHEFRFSTVIGTKYSHILVFDKILKHCKITSYIIVEFFIYYFDRIFSEGENRTVPFSVKIPKSYRTNI